MKPKKRENPVHEVKSMKVQTWVAAELSFTGTIKYDNPFEEVDLNVTFTCGRHKFVMPGFWDGGQIWRCRFALPKAGVWHYAASSTDPANKGLTGEGDIECVKYEGDLPIYQHGFVKTEPGKRYFVYDDGTPFFYLGDTHWNFAVEEFDEPGDHADDLACDSHFKKIVDVRREQGFNVYQSEPIGARYSLSKGLFESDIEGFKDLDRRFAYIAENGFVHANAQLLFPRDVVRMERYDDEAYLIRLARYWAARYAAYPVMWTLGQEVDNDFYFTRGDQKRFEKENNPFKLFAKGLHDNDPYRHPLTAHMEYCSLVPGPAGDGTAPSLSAFREVPGHDWFGYQWSRGLDRPLDYEFARDGFLNGQGKVCILYESRYDRLWTKEYGARSEGWIAYLNGLYGYGYGAIDIWLYKSTYDINRESNDGYDIATPEDKQLHWSKSVFFDTAKQMGYMKAFFEKLAWWKLVPRFNSPAWFTPDGENFHSVASDERNTIVIYFFRRDDFSTGVLHNLEKVEYTYQWFNPRTGVYGEKRSFWPDAHRDYRIEQKPDKFDWVLLVEKKK